MPSSPLAALAAQLATATDPHAALQIVNAELAQSERGAGFGLLTGRTKGVPQEAPLLVAAFMYTVLVYPDVEFPATGVQVAQTRPVVSLSIVMDSLELLVMVVGNPLSSVYLPPA